VAWRPASATRGRTGGRCTSCRQQVRLFACRRAKSVSCEVLGRPRSHSCGPATSSGA
jgi:hypothetical protein